MAENLDSFITKFNGGSRAHRYTMSDCPFPEAVSVDGDLAVDKYHVRALEIPPSQVNPIRIPYRGRILKWAGDRLYFPWTIRILDEEGSKNAIDTLWKAFHKWSDLINDHETNIHNTGGGTDFSNWTKDWTFEQVDGKAPASGSGDDENPIKIINLFGLWPTTIGPIGLDANSIDQVVEFTVTFEYQYYTIDYVTESTTTPLSGDENSNGSSTSGSGGY